MKMRFLGVISFTCEIKYMIDYWQLIKLAHINVIENKETLFSINQNWRFLLESSISVHDHLKRPNTPAKKLYKLKCIR